MDLHGPFFVFIFFVKQQVYANNVYFSKWIKPDPGYPWNVYNFETDLQIGVESCVQRCKAKKMCKYVNFNVKANVCFLVATNTTIASFNPEDNIENNTGFILGRKLDWNMDQYEACHECEPHGVCKRDEQSAEQYPMCQTSGCEPPEDKKFAGIHGNLFSTGNSIRYKCKEEYVKLQNGNETSICQMSGMWTPTEINCVPADTYGCFKTSCYYLDRIVRSWNDAKLNCESLGGYLTDIKTEAEWIFLRDNLLDGTPAWFGGNDKEIEGMFRWLDGTAVSNGYAIWEAEQPDDTGLSAGSADCMMYIKSMQMFLWHDTLCSSTLWSVCEFSI